MFVRIRPVRRTPSQECCSDVSWPTPTLSVSERERQRERMTAGQMPSPYRQPDSTHAGRFLGNMGVCVCICRWNHIRSTLYISQVTWFHSPIFCLHVQRASEWAVSRSLDELQMAHMVAALRRKAAVVGHMTHGSTPPANRAPGILHPADREHSGRSRMDPVPVQEP